MSGKEAAIPPPVMWAQRKGEVFLTFTVETTNPIVKIEPESLYFKGTGSNDSKLYELKIPFYAKVDAENSTTAVKGRCVEVILRKQNKNEHYWPTLTNDKIKHHWLKVDFNKWADSDDENDAPAGFGGDNEMNIEEMLKSMGGAGGMGMGGMGDKPSLDDLDDSDDEELPDLE